MFRSKVNPRGLWKHRNPCKKLLLIQFISDRSLQLDLTSISIYKLLIRRDITEHKIGGY